MSFCVYVTFFRREQPHRGTKPGQVTSPTGVYHVNGPMSRMARKSENALDCFSIQGKSLFGSA